MPKLYERVAGDVDVPTARMVFKRSALT
jgi:hypothetical protein